MTTSKTSVARDNWLLDTGPVVALLSKTDSAHAACAAALEGFRGHLITTESVLTEAMHLCAVRRVRRTSASTSSCKAAQYSLR